MSVRILHWINAIGGLIVGTAFIVFGRYRMQGKRARQVIICGAAVALISIVLLLTMINRR
jgi:hypothetical protein